MEKKILATLFLLTLAFSGCVTVQKISEIKNDSYVGKTVTVSGTVTDSIKLGTLSGYIIDDSSGTMPVSAVRLPAEGDKVTVSGTLISDTLFGYYIKANE
jgi:hypothetical protein